MGCSFSDHAVCSWFTIYVQLPDHFLLRLSCLYGLALSLERECISCWAHVSLLVRLLAEKKLSGIQLFSLQTFVGGT